MPTAELSTDRPPLRLLLWLEVGNLLRVLLISLWVTIWYQTLMGLESDVLKSFTILTLALLGSHYLTRFFTHFHWQPGRSRLVFLVWMAILIVVSLRWIVFPAEGIVSGTFIEQAIQAVLMTNPDLRILLHLLVIILLTWRGIALTQGSMDQGEVLRSFQVGTAMFLIYGLLFGNNFSVIGFWPVYLFLLVGLMALATTRITDLSFMRGGRLPGSFRSWWLPLLAAALATTAVALLFGWLLSQQIGAISTLLIAILFLTVFLVAAVVALPVLLILYLVMPWLQQKFAEGLAELNIQNPQVLADQIFGEELQKIAESNTGIDSFYLVIAGIILLALIVIVLISVRNNSQKRRLNASDEDFQNIQPSRTMGREPGSGQNLFNRFRNANRYLAAARIRRMYALLIELSEKLGLPRPPSSTPSEFEPVMASVFPGCESELTLLTNAYLRVRYGELPETEQEVQQVSAAWERVRSQGRRLLQQKKKADKNKPPVEG